MMSEIEPIRILLADDHDLYRNALREWLSDEAGLLVVGEARNGNEAVRLAEQLRPDVIVLDVILPGLNGIEATRQIMKSAPGVKVVALSLHDDPGFVNGMLEAGARSYMLKDDDRKHLVEGIRAVWAAKTTRSPRLRDTRRYPK